MQNKKFDYYIKTEKNFWEVVIGLEVHAQVISDSKLFPHQQEPNICPSHLDKNGWL